MKKTMKVMTEVAVELMYVMINGYEDTKRGGIIEFVNGKVSRIHHAGATLPKRHSRAGVLKLAQLQLENPACQYIELPVIPRQFDDNGWKEYV